MQEISVQHITCMESPKKIQSLRYQSVQQPGGVLTADRLHVKHRLDVDSTTLTGRLGRLDRATQARSGHSQTDVT